MVPARERGDHLAGAGADFADTRDRLERLGLFFDGNSGASAFRVPEEKAEEEVRIKKDEGGRAEGKGKLRRKKKNCGLRNAESKERAQGARRLYLIKKEE